VGPEHQGFWEVIVFGVYEDFASSRYTTLTIVSNQLMMLNMEGPPLLVSLTLKKKLLAKLYEILEAINCAKVNVPNLSFLERYSQHYRTKHVLAVDQLFWKLADMVS
jgi:hypothetical protein